MAPACKHELHQYQDEKKERPLRRQGLLSDRSRLNFQASLSSRLTNHNQISLLGLFPQTQRPVFRVFGARVVTCKIGAFFRSACTVVVEDVLLVDVDGLRFAFFFDFFLPTWRSSGEVEGDAGILVLGLEIC